MREARLLKPMTSVASLGLKSRLFLAINRCLGQITTEHARAGRGRPIAAERAGVLFCRRSVRYPVSRRADQVGVWSCRGQRVDQTNDHTEMCGCPEVMTRVARRHERALSILVTTLGSARRSMSAIAPSVNSPMTVVTSTPLTAHSRIWRSASSVGRGISARLG